MIQYSQFKVNFLLMTKWTGQNKLTTANCETNKITALKEHVVVFEFLIHYYKLLHINYYI